MIKKCVATMLAVLFTASASGARAAEAPRQVTWEDLTVKLTAADNPFLSLTEDQLLTLSEVAGVRDRRARGDNVSPADVANERAGTAKLEKAGIDVTGLLARRNEIGERVRAVSRAINPTLNGRIVRLPGYLLPLEFSGKQVTEFLLVPWVGACIHTPPPAPNQIVHVKPDKPIELKGMFDAVFVTGRLAANASRKSVHVVDGSADVDVGYSMTAAQVEHVKH